MTESTEELAVAYGNAADAARRIVEPAERALSARIAAAKREVEQFVHSGGTQSGEQWEYEWLAQVRLIPEAIEERGIWLAYPADHPYPDDGFAPFELLDNIVAIVGAEAAKRKFAKQVAVHEARERKRAKLLAQLAELDAEA